MKRLLLILLLVGCLMPPAHAQEVFSESINNEVPFVEYPFEVQEENSVVTLDVQATNGDLDTLIYLVDEDGSIVAENDDIVKGNTNSHLVYEGLPVGRYIAVVTRYGVDEGSTAGNFDFTLTIEPQTPVQLDYQVDDDALAAAGYPEQDAAEKADWTILAYYGADTDLEPALIDDLDEFERGFAGENIRVLVLVDRNPEYTDADGDWSTTRIYEVTADTTGDHGSVYPPTIDSVMLADLGELDTSNGETLAQFLVWGIKHYPAENYAISIGGHGAGWEGVAPDYSTDGDHPIMTLPELQSAFTLAKEAAGVEKFDLMINDACLMSSVEYYHAITPYFDLSLASPEIVVNPALDMSLFLQQLSADTELTAIGTALVDKYILEDILQRGPNEAVYYTNAVTNLDTFQPVIVAIEQFAVVVNEDPARYAEILGLARSNTYTYSAFLNDDRLVDVGHLMEQVIISTKDATLITAAENVINALIEARVYGNAGEKARRRSSYYNIYFPEKSKDFDNHYFAQSGLDEWGRMLRNFYNFTNPRRWAVEDSVLTYHPPTAPKVDITLVYPQVASITNPPTIEMEIQGRNIARGTFTVDQLLDDGSSLRLLSSPILTEITIGSTSNMVNQWRSGVDQSQFSWMPMTLTTISDGTTTANELLIRNAEFAILEGRYQEEGSDTWNDVLIMFSIESHEVVYVISNNGDTLAEIQIAEGATFQSYRQKVTADGRLVRVEGETYTWGELRWDESPAPSGNYRLGFFVETYGGTSGFDSVEITVDNESADAEKRGFTDLDLGVTFQYPSTWQTPFYSGSQIIGGNPELTVTMPIAFFTTQWEDNPWKVAEDFRALYGLEGQADDQEVTIGDQTGVEFTYSYQLEDGTTWYGKALALYRMTVLGKTGLVFGIEAKNVAELNAYYTDLIATLQFFDAVELATQKTAVWSYRFIQPQVAMPIPSGWQLNPANETQFLLTSEAYPNVSVELTISSGTDADTVFNTLASGAQDITYQNELKTWKLADFTTDANFERLYVTQINEQVFSLRFKAPQNEATVALVRNVFELIVDGFAPSSNLQYALGGVNPTLLKAAMTRAATSCEGQNPNEACYGEGSLIVEGSSDVSFENVGDRTGVDTLEEIYVGFDEESTSFDAFSIAIVEPEVSADGGTQSSIRLGIFGGISFTLETVEE